MEKYVKEDLEKYIFIDCLSYDAIGSLYGVGGAAIRKAAKKLGIILPTRRKISSSESFNKGVKRVIKYCKNCGKEIPNENTYCSNTCQTEYHYNEYIRKWKEGIESGITGKSEVSTHIRKYLFIKYGHKCQKCGWGEINPITQNIPLELHHIDGNCLNNQEENLELLCPNCHSLTDNYGSLNKSSKRY